MTQSTTPITEFFKNRSVFVTGATGFLGKACVEKLLRTCHGVKSVYILIRPKSGSSVQARFQKLLENSIFDTLKQENPDVLKKIVPIRGEITHPCLGISKQDQDTLTNEVSVVIHSAATVKFDEHLKLAANLNIHGTKRLVELSKGMKKLAAFIHVSTAYANCEHDKIDEMVYNATVDPNNLIKLLEYMDDNIIKTITPQLIGRKPNTYTYTKALAETLLTTDAHDLPVCIVRPSIVTATKKEPVAGWIDTVYGATGLMAAHGEGVLRSLMCYGNKVFDLVPVDIVVNLILSSAWYTAEHSSGNIKVYNCCTGTQNPLLWSEFDGWLFKYMVKNPLSDVLWYPASSLKANRFCHYVNHFFIHYVPAFMMDFVARLTSKKPVMLKVYKTIAKTLHSLQYFTTNEWKFRTDNVTALYKTLSLEDKRMFNSDVKEIDWSEYLESYFLGIRKYVRKDDPSTMPNARKRILKLYWIHRLTQFIILLLFLGVVFHFETIPNLWCYMCALHSN